MPPLLLALLLAVDGTSPASPAPTPAVGSVVQANAPPGQPPASVSDPGPPPPPQADGGGAPAASPALGAAAPVPRSDATGLTTPPFVPIPEVLSERVSPQQEFVKGELSVFLGSDRLSAKKNRIGISAGINQIGAVYYLLAEPQVDLRFFDRKLALGFGVPLNFEMVNLDSGSNGQPIGTQNLGTLRKQDWAVPSDYAKILQYLTYGRKEDSLYINVGQRYASSVGHGALIRRYAPNIDVNFTRVSAQIDAYTDYVGFEAMTNDVVQWNVVGGLVFVKPLAFIDSLFTHTLSLGASAAADLQAPKALTVDASGTRQVDSTGQLVATRTQVVVAGVDAEVKVVKTDSVDIKPFADYSMLLGGDAGLTLGVLGRFNFGKEPEPVHALRLVAEIKRLGSRYQPAYFDTFYEVDRYQAAVGPAPANYLTKYQLVMSGAVPDRYGYYFEASYGIRGKVGLTVALEGTDNTSARNFVAHLEVPWLDFFQLFASYYKRGFTDFGQLLTVDAQSIFFAGARLRTLPFLFFNGRAYKTFQVNQPLRRYDNVFGFMVDMEIGWEFWTQDQELKEGHPTGS